jgi:hypothetical protein
MFKAFLKENCNKENLIFRILHLLLHFIQHGSNHGNFWVGRIWWWRLGLFPTKAEEHKNEDDTDIDLKRRR